MWVAEKFQSNSEIAGSPRNSFRASLMLDICLLYTSTLIHELTYERTNRNLSVHGYQEEGTITTPFDMRVQNEIDRFHLVKEDVYKRQMRYWLIKS